MNWWDQPTTAEPEYTEEQKKVCNDYKKIVDGYITASRKGDPTLKSVKQVVRVYAEDESGNREVLYIDANNQPQSAYVRGRDVSLSEGW